MHLPLSACLIVNDSILDRMDLHESKDKNEMTATFELPGMTKEDIDVDVHNNRLVVSGQGTISNELDNDGYVVRERRFGKFSRTLPLPSGTKVCILAAYVACSGADLSCSARRHQSYGGKRSSDGEVPEVAA
jgi:hypothetical protein